MKFKKTKRGLHKVSRTRFVRLSTIQVGEINGSNFCPIQCCNKNPPEQGYNSHCIPPLNGRRIQHVCVSRKNKECHLHKNTVSKPLENQNAHHSLAIKSTIPRDPTSTQHHSERGSLTHTPTLLKIHHATPHRSSPKTQKSPQDRK